MSAAAASSPARPRKSASAQAAVAHAVLERPNRDALFGGMEPEKLQAPSASPPRARSRVSCSEPLLPSSFGGADRANASELSVATTAFLPGSHLGSSLALPDALAMAVAGSASPVPSKQTEFQRTLPYRTELESSVVSDWKAQMWREGGKGLALERGLRFQDLRYGNKFSPGVCVLQLDGGVPKVPGLTANPDGFGPVAEKQRIIDCYTKQLLSMGVALTEPHHHGQDVGSPDKNSSICRTASATELSTRSPGMTRSASQVSIASHHHRRNNLCSVVARDRYQKYIVANPRKGHRYCEPESHHGPEA
jgi:hypothetical protein